MKKNNVQEKHQVQYIYQHDEDIMDIGSKLFSAL